MPVNTNLTLTAKIEGSISTPGAFGAPTKNIVAAAVLPLTTGVAAGQADTVYSATRTLAASANESLDLIGGLTDDFGNTVNLAKVVALFIRAATGNTNSLIVGGAAANGFFPMFGTATDTIKLPPGAWVMLGNDAGYVATGATADLLKIANGGAGTPVTYDIVAVGRSA